MFQIICMLLKWAEKGKAVVTVNGRRRNLNRVIWTIALAVVFACISAGAPFDY